MSDQRITPPVNQPLQSGVGPAEHRAADDARLIQRHPGVPSAPEDVEPLTRLYTESEMRSYAQEIANGRIDQRRSAEARRAPSSPAPDVSGALAQLIQLQIAQQLGAMQPAGAQRPAIPVSGLGGAPPVPSVPLEEQSLVRMSPSDREALIAAKGNRWFVDRLNAELHTTRVKLR